jgi:hypothetical protein
MSDYVTSTSDGCQRAIGGDGPAPSGCVHALAHPISLHVDFALKLPGPEVTVAQAANAR